MVFIFSLNLISPSFGASGRLCFVTVEFPGYFHLYFRVNKVDRVFKTIQIHIYYIVNEIYINHLSKHYKPFVYAFV